MKRFDLRRYKDVLGVSGTGAVAEGVEFTDGICVLRWLSDHSSTAIYNSIDDIKKIHDHHDTKHAGGTHVVWRDK